jgi:predicted PurR-regulated permease PerM
MRGQIEMHIGLIFISVLGGIGVFGLIGILTGPLVATFFLAMLRLYQRDYATTPVVSPP